MTALQHCGAAYWVVLVFCQVLPVASGCGASPKSVAVPPLNPEASLPPLGLYCPDEHLKWSLRWKGLEAATSEMVTGQPGEIDGKPAIIVYSLSRSSELARIFREVSEELTSHISLVTGRPLQNVSHNVEDRVSEILDVDYSDTRPGYSASLSGTVKKREWTHDGDAADFHSFLARLRFWDGTPASGTFVFVQSARSYYRVDLAVRESKSISTPAGKTAAIRIHGHATRLHLDGKKLEPPEVREFTLWRSDDSRFLPLRFEVETRLGLVRGTLVDFHQGDLAKCIETQA
ncbi:MAG: DUF3108 domain-containing protein [Myxococcales bacterium]|nr:DUF3108 domain-containing protein [Myxococcales bacterium]